MCLTTPGLVNQVTHRMPKEDEKSDADVLGELNERKEKVQSCVSGQDHFGGRNERLYEYIRMVVRLSCICVCLAGFLFFLSCICG